MELSRNEFTIGQDVFTICPHCFKPMNQCSMFPEENTRQGFFLRRYFGWCENCQVGFEVIQFRPIDNDKWHIHKFQPYSYIEINHIIKLKEWTIVELLPQPPAVLQGPGGDYDIDINPQIIESVKILQNTLSAVAKATETLLNCFKKK